jgi:Protein of unknown function (DUF1572)
MTLLADIEHEFRRHKKLADGATAALDDAAFFAQPGGAVNPVALVVKHIAGNLASRWTDFLTSDGDKASRDRDGEFLLQDADTRPALLAAWERGWKVLFDTLATVRDSDLDRTVTIRGEPHTVCQALLRSATHTAYHVGQIAYVARLLRPDAQWLTIPPGGSREHVPGYRKRP